MLEPTIRDRNDATSRTAGARIVDCVEQRAASAKQPQLAYVGKD